MENSISDASEDNKLVDSPSGIGQKAPRGRGGPLPPQKKNSATQSSSKDKHQLSGNDSQSNSSSASSSSHSPSTAARGGRGGPVDASAMKKDWRAEREQQQAEEKARAEEREAKVAQWSFRPGDVRDADWTHIAHLKRSKEGSTGVFFVDRPSGTVVIKGTIGGI